MNKFTRIILLLFTTFGMMPSICLYADCGPLNIGGPGLPYGYLTIMNGSMIDEDTPATYHNPVCYKYVAMPSFGTIPLQADPAPVGKIFNRWNVVTSPAVNGFVTDIYSSNSSFTPFQTDATLTATYKSLPPKLTSVTPNTAPAGYQSNLTKITLTGSNFVAGGNFVIGTTVRIGNYSTGKVTFVSATQLTTVAPINSAGTYDVVVTNPDGQSAKLTGGFRYTTTSSAN